MSLLLFSGLTLFKHSWDSKNFCWASFSWFNDDVNNSISYNNAIKEVNILRAQSITNIEIDTYFLYLKIVTYTVMYSSEQTQKYMYVPVRCLISLI